VRPDTDFIRFPEKRPPTLFLTHDGPPDQTMFAMDWPLYVAKPERRREEVALLLLSRVFDAALRHRVRQQMGKSYAPSVDLYAPDRADQAYIEATVLTAPADLDDVLIAARGVARKLSGGDIGDADIEEARKPLLASLLARERTNQWWIDGLIGSSLSGDGLEEMRDYRRLAGEVSPDEVRQAASTWLARSPFLSIASPASHRAGEYESADR
jgi:zinc protease